MCHYEVKCHKPLWLQALNGKQTQSSESRSFLSKKYELLLCLLHYCSCAAKSNYLQIITWSPILLNWYVHVNSLCSRPCLVLQSRGWHWVASRDLQWRRSLLPLVQKWGASPKRESSSWALTQTSQRASSPCKPCFFELSQANQHLNFIQ